MKNLTWQNPEQLFVAQELINKVKSKCCGIKVKQVAEIEDYGYILLNQQWKKAWGGDYIDLLTPAMTDQNHVRVFTDDNRYISQDCRHLTPAGAQWYAQILDWKNIFKEKQPRYQ